MIAARLLLSLLAAFLTRRLDAPRGGVAMDVLTGLVVVALFVVLGAGCAMLVEWP